MSPRRRCQRAVLADAEEHALIDHRGVKEIRRFAGRLAVIIQFLQTLEVVKSQSLQVLGGRRAKGGSADGHPPHRRFVFHAPEHFDERQNLRLDRKIHRALVRDFVQQGADAIRNAVRQQHRRFKCAVEQEQRLGVWAGAKPFAFFKEARSEIA